LQGLFERGCSILVQSRFCLCFGERAKPVY
jgi:hypothetical protein